MGWELGQVHSISFDGRNPASNDGGVDVVRAEHDGGRGRRLTYLQSRLPVNTTDESKWIFVLSTTRSLYVGQKHKGHFQHSELPRQRRHARGG